MSNIPDIRDARAERDLFRLVKHYHTVEDAIEKDYVVKALKEYNCSDDLISMILSNGVIKPAASHKGMHVSHIPRYLLMKFISHYDLGSVNFSDFEYHTRVKTKITTPEGTFKATFFVGDDRFGVHVSKGTYSHKTYFTLEPDENGIIVNSKMSVKNVRKNTKKIVRDMAVEILSKATEDWGWSEEMIHAMVNFKS